MFKSIIILILFSLCNSSAYGAQYDQLELNRCEEGELYVDRCEFQKSDELLNTQWKVLSGCYKEGVKTGGLNQSVANFILESQRNWNTNKHQKVGSSIPFCGSLPPEQDYSQYACLYKITEKRTEFINQQIEDLSRSNVCPSFFN